MTAGVAPQTGRWPGLDGLRGIAAAVVVLFHAQFGVAVNGYVGVDVFFALSGFLITSILLKELGRRGRVRFGRFYLRRLLRLYPALVVTCLLVVTVGLASGNGVEYAVGAAAALAYISNWWMYTGNPAPLLEHTWTLAIEEHFYFLWPPLLIALFSRRRVVQIAGATLIAVALVLLFTPWAESIRHVRGTYLRGFPIALGAVLAIVLHRWGSRLPTRALAVAGGLALVALLAVLLMPYRLPEPWLTGPNSIPAALTLVVVASVVLVPASAGATVLTWAPLRWLGGISYGLYLYHFPILQALRHHVDIGPEWGRMLIGVAASLLVAWASFKWVEEPFLQLKERLDARQRPRTDLPVVEPVPLGEER